MTAIRYHLSTTMIQITASILMLLFAIRVNQLCNVTAHDTYDIQKPLTMSTNCLIDSDSKLALCDNRNYIGNPFKFRSFKKPPLKPSHRSIISLMLFICGDVEMNPGPGNSSIYPCGFCDCKVSWTDKGVCCDDCSIWYHKSCISMPSTDYDNLEDFSWHCIKCRTPLSHDTFHSYEQPIRLEGPEDPKLQVSAVTWPRSRFNTSGPDPLGFDWEGLAASRGTAGGHSGLPPLK